MSEWGLLPKTRDNKCMKMNNNDFCFSAGKKYFSCNFYTNVSLNRFISAFLFLVICMLICSSETFHLDIVSLHI